jgi:hypothetical protein
MWIQIATILSTLTGAMIGFGIYMIIQSWVWKRQNRKAVEKWDKELDEKINQIRTEHNQWVEEMNNVKNF